MSGNDPIIEQLKDLGLTANEAKVYLGMLGRSTFKAAEIARQADVPRPKVYETINSLMDKGLCFQVPGSDDGVALYSAADPKEGLAAWQQQREEEQRESLARRRIRTADVISALEPIHVAGRDETAPLRYVDVLTDKLRIAQVANAMLASATEQVLTFDKEPYAQDPSVLHLHESNAARRGVDVRCIFEAHLAHLTGRLVASGAQVRLVPRGGLPMKLVVADGQAAIYALRDPITGQQSLTSMRVAHPDFAQAMVLLFESLWQNATPLSGD